MSRSRNRAIPKIKTERFATGGLFRAFNTVNVHGFTMQNGFFRFVVAGREFFTSGWSSEDSVYCYTLGSDGEYIGDWYDSDSLHPIINTILQILKDEEEEWYERPDMIVSGCIRWWL